MSANLFRTTAMVAAVGVAAPAMADTTLTILHFNDFHSRIEPINAFDSTCSAEDDAAGECFGGIARMATALNELRADAVNPVVVAAGDIFQGSLMYTTFKGDVEIEMMNAIGLDVLALGNHEFDDGPANLHRTLQMAEFPVISGNLDLSQSPDLTDMDVDDYVILEIGGAQVGFIGSLTTDTVEIASPGPNIIFQDEIDAMQGDVDDLAAQGVDIIIAVTHNGYVLDQEIAASVTGLDAIIGGHSNTLLGQMEGAMGPYPTMVANPDGVMVPVVQAYAYSKYVGELVLNFDDEGNLVEAGGTPVLLDAAFAPDPDIAARVAEFAEPIAEEMAVVVGESTGPIEGDRSFCRAVECEMGNLVADAMLDRVRDQGIQIAIQNGGGLRASIDEGEVTMGEVLTVLPFQNTLATFQLTGEGVIEALENGVSQVEEGAGRFPQVAGLRFTWDPAAEPGSRIVSAEVDMDGEWTAIDPAATYGVVSNNYMRGGGDGYATFTQAANAYDFGPGLEQVVADYISANSPYEPYTDGRISEAE
ncbi:multifunctional 2',3'-cyclic-nucleotide 2'-phosphodiesterase/5'-nucleotidase/3'-nucleotidase [Rhodobacterales bacterium HKCCE3408]|nr:multifunctional 2',3'-cyclic-nucleotide 2'-phosphodiesterase/5'-nucleotidase/3'-nucleotidase [Rhodobacterales bacterium HKCCE3408]